MAYVLSLQQLQNFIWSAHLAEVIDQIGRGKNVDGGKIVLKQKGERQITEGVMYVLSLLQQESVCGRPLGRPYLADVVRTYWRRRECQSQTLSCDKKRRKG